VPGVVIDEESTASNSEENRQSSRPRLVNMTKIRLAPNAPLRDCPILDISDEG
jgi:hypothetical protein